MSAWRREALNRLPEFRKDIASSRNVYALWISLFEWLQDAYEPPENTDRIRRIYDYLEWARNQPSTNDAETDPFTAAACCFIEHIPEHAKSRADMPHWFSRSQIVEWKGIFEYQIGEDGYRSLLELWGVSPMRPQK